MGERRELGDQGGLLGGFRMPRSGSGCWGRVGTGPDPGSPSRPWQRHPGARLTSGEQLLPSTSPTPGGQAPCTRLLSGYLGCRLRQRWLSAPWSRGAVAPAPTMPPSRVLTPGRRGSTRGSGNLRGAARECGAPHYCFISRGPAKNNAGHETVEPDLAGSPESCWARRGLCSQGTPEL